MSFLYFSWSELEKRWRLKGVDLWELLDEELVPIYRQTSKYNVRADHFDASEVDSLRVLQEPALALEERLCLKFMRAQARKRPTILILGDGPREQRFQGILERWGLPKPESLQRKPPRPRHSSLVKEEVRRIAAEIWEKEDISIDDMARRDEIYGHAKKKNGKFYDIETIKKWLHKRNPHRRMT